MRRQQDGQGGSFAILVVKTVRADLFVVFFPARQKRAQQRVGEGRGRAKKKIKKKKSRSSEMTAGLFLRSELNEHRV